jgi:putative ABC transport system permease protein
MFSKTVQIFFMLKNFFKITFRRLWRNKGFTAINIAGLSVGMASAMLILLWVQHEISYDRFHDKTERISLLYSRDENNGKMDAWGRTSSMMTPVLKQDFGEVEEAVRIRDVYFLVTAGEKHLNSQGAFADSGFLSLFSYPLLTGDANNALADNHNIVLTEPLAIKLFGREDPMGRTVRIDSTDNFKVTGVLKDLPGNTELGFEYLLPWSYLTKLGWDQSWGNTNTSTYVLLRKGSSRAAFDAKLKNIVKTHIMEGQGSTMEVFTQPLSRVHLYSKVENGQLTDGRIVMVRLFATIAVFILLIACINFMNLSTARSEKRAKEVGIRKVVGAYRSSLMMQFIGESILIALFAFAIALCLVNFSLKGFNEIVGETLYVDFRNPYFWLFAFAFILFTGLLAGSYPAFYLSSFQPVKVLKGTFKKVNALVTPRKILVTLQFTFAILLITCTMIVERQIQFSRGRDAGYSRDHLIYIFNQGDINKHYDLIRQGLVNSGAAVAVSKTFSPITRAWGNVAGLSWSGSTAADKKINFLQFAVDADFVKTIGTHLLQGRDIDIRNYPSDSTALLLNETAVKTMRLRNPVGQTVQNQNGVYCHVIGIIKDFIMESPYEEIEPMVIQGSLADYGPIHIRLNPANNTLDDLAKAERVFKEYNPQFPFEYVFVDEAYGLKFREEQREGELAALFAGLTVFISCLGLFGLATYMAETRIKEIGVRKVLGASVTGIATLLSKDFLKLVLLSILLACPIAFFVMHRWLLSFSYRIEIGWWVFVLAGSLAMAIALLTVSYQAIKAAMANPIKSLRTN